jgi:ABC-type transport system involved in cytochrome bd biosynthesis fused ATPase/permease subunit
MTHSLALMQAADRVVVLAGGVVQVEGGFEQLRAAGALDDILSEAQPKTIK